MSDAVIFTLIFGGLFVLRIVAATAVFMFILPKGDRCPNCNAVTLRMEKSGMDRLFPYFRLSWCMECNWEGMLRPGPLTPESTPVGEAEAGRPIRHS